MGEASRHYFRSLAISRSSWVQHRHGCHQWLNRCSKWWHFLVTHLNSTFQSYQVGGFRSVHISSKSTTWVIKRICLFDDGHDMPNSDETTAFFFVEGIRHHPKQFHVGVAFCSSWWQQTWWTKCVSKHLACPFPMTYFSSCEIQSHTNLLPKSLNIFYHFTFFNICVQPKKRFCLDMVSSPVPPGEDIKTKRHSWGTQVWCLCWELWQWFVFMHMHIRCTYCFLDLCLWVAVSNLSMFNPYSWYFADILLQLGWRSSRSLISKHHRAHNRKKTAKTLPRFWQIATEELLILCSILVPMNYHETYMFQVLISLSILVALNTLFLQRFW